MRQRNARRYGRNRRGMFDDQYHSSTYKDVLLAEFKYYNGKTEIIPPQELDVIEKSVRSKKKVVFWTNKLFGDNNIGFIFFMKTVQTNNEKDNVEEDVYIRMEKFSAKLRINSFRKLHHIYDNKIFLSFEPEDWIVDVLEGFEFNKYSHPTRGGYMLPPFDTWEQIVNSLIEMKVVNYFAHCDKSEWNLYANIVNKLFGVELTEPQVIGSDDYYYGDGAFFIMDVVEKRINDVNYRVALLVKVGTYNEFTMRVFSDKHEDYTYIDKGKLFIISNNKRFFFDDTTLEYSEGKLLVDLKLMKKISENVNQILTNEEKVITPMIYRFYRERVLVGSFNTERLSAKELALIERYKTLLKDDKPIKINQVYVSKYMIQVAGEGFKLEFEPDFLNVIEKFGDIKRLIKSDVVYNFNEFYEGLLKLSTLRILDSDYYHTHNYKKFAKAKFKINGMDIIVSKDNSRARINGIFCRIDDILHVLNKCICYHDVDEFNSYVRDVSYIGVEWKKMISNGIALQLNNPLHSFVGEVTQNSIDSLYLRFSMYWDVDKRSQVYLKLSSEKYLIKYKGKFKRHFNVPRRSLTIEQLKRELKDSIPDLDDSMLLEIIDNAVEEAKIVKKRGQELVANTIKDVQAQETVINIRGVEIQGYLFFGRTTKSKYFVEKVKLTVYKFMDGTWNRRCIVDDHNKQRIYEDRLANRLVNIYNEPRYLAGFLKT